MKTGQEIFDQVVAHLRKQGKKSYSIEGDMCMYRSHDGLKCAVGCLIPDSDYHPNFESKNISFLLKEKVLSPPLHAELFEHQSLLLDLQNAHDFALNWEEAFQKIAHDYNLQYQSP